MGNWIDVSMIMCVDKCKEMNEEIPSTIGHYQTNRSKQKNRRAPSPISDKMTQHRPNHLPCKSEAEKNNCRKSLREEK